MGKNQVFLLVNLSKARDNCTWAVSWLEELMVTPLPSPSFPPPLLRVSVSKTFVCRFKTSPCVPAPRLHVVTRGRFESTHGGFFCVPSRATHHTTQHNTTQHATPHGDGETQRQRQTETERDRERDRERETRQEKRRRDNKREETRR